MKSTIGIKRRSTSLAITLHPILLDGLNPYFKLLCPITGSVVAPYLVNVRKLSDEESLSIIRGWLEKCNSIKRLSFDPKYVLKYNIRKSKRIGYYPISWNALRTENMYVYQRLTVRKCVP